MHIYEPPHLLSAVSPLYLCVARCVGSDEQNGVRKDDGMTGSEIVQHFVNRKDLFVFVPCFTQPHFLIPALIGDTTSGLERYERR